MIPKLKLQKNRISGDFSRINTDWSKVFWTGLLNFYEGGIIYEFSTLRH